MRSPASLRSLLVLGVCLSVGAACGDDGAVRDAGPGDTSPRDGGGRDGGGFDPAAYLDAEVFAYDWSCSGEVAPDLIAPVAEPSADDCAAGIWPDLEPTLVCPTVTEAARTDPDTGEPLPPADDRSLPTTIEVSESGSFLPAELPMSWPATLRVVAWNMEYTSHLDEQLDTLTDDPELAAADVYLLSEVDRCSTRNGVRRAARMLAERIGGAYAYGIEFIELSIGRDIGGDTGQAIVSRRPLTGVGMLCHSAQYDWFGDDGEPRLGERVVLYADLPVADTHARVYALHFESNDILGEKRAIQVKELLDVAQAGACERPQVVAGDFNTWYRTAPELVLLRNAGFEDVLEGLGHFGGTHDNGTRLDYIWTRGFTASEGGVKDEIMTSDHRPIWVDLSL